jgi:AmmeMemoRadiSam system protein A
MELNHDQRQALLDAARQTIRSALGDRGVSSQPRGQEDPVLRQPAGCFVTLHSCKTRRLRGCVGRLDCHDELIKSVRQSAASVLQDPRFVNVPVRLEELPELEIEITVILPLKPAVDFMDFALEDEGIFLTVNERTGCFLPQVARETGWTREQLLSRLCTEKLGLGADAWRDPSAKLMKFGTLLVGPQVF